MSKKTRNGGARARHGSNLQIFERLQQRVESVNYLGFFFRSTTGKRQWLKCNKTQEKLPNGKDSRAVG